MTRSRSATALAVFVIAFDVVMAASGGYLVYSHFESGTSYAVKMVGTCGTLTLVYGDKAFAIEGATSITVEIPAHANFTVWDNPGPDCRLTSWNEAGNGGGGGKAVGLSTVTTYPDRIVFTNIEAPTTLTALTAPVDNGTQ
jgi:hypothetical protein